MAADSSTELMIGNKSTAFSLPGNQSVEQELLGALILDNDVIDSVDGFLEPEHFHDLLHGRLFSVIRDLVRSGRSATPAIIADCLREIAPSGEKSMPADDDHRLSRDYLANLAKEAAAPNYARDYGRHIYNLAVRRALIRFGGDVAARAGKDLQASSESQIEAAESALYQIAERGRYQSGPRTFESVLASTEEEIRSAALRHDGMIGLATGLSDFDKMTGGLHKSDLIIVAGRPAMGKTALATSVAFHIAAHHGNGGGSVGFFSLEMSAEQLATRILSMRTQIQASDIRRGNIGADRLEMITDEMKRIQKTPFYIDESGALSLGALTARARRLKRGHGLDLIVVDYLQLMTESSRSYRDNRVHEVTMISRGLKALAKELNVPVIAVSQLSRQVESRDDKRPQLADLRDSGAIEQDADLVLFVYREEHYIAQREPSSEKMEDYAKWQKEMQSVYGLGELIIGKHRHGPTGIIKVHFNTNLMLFGNLERKLSYDSGESP